MKGLSTSRSCANSSKCLSEKGFKFVIRYYSETTRYREKVITPAEARILSNANISIGAVYQDRNNQVGDFDSSKGTQDAFYAYIYAQTTGQTKNSAIFFAVDFDPSTNEIKQYIVPHFKAIKQQFDQLSNGPTYKIGIYGSGLSCRILKDELKIADYSWLAQSTGWRESKTYTNWDIKQDFPNESICKLEENYELCLTKSDDIPWAFTPAPKQMDFDPDDIPILRYGSKGTEVRLLQQLMNSWLSEERLSLLKVDGIFGNRTYRSVRAFQSKNVDQFCSPLVVDGIVGPLSSGAILRYSSGEAPPECIQPIEWFNSMPDASQGGSKIGRAALQVAINELNANAREIGGNNMGPFVEKYLSPAKLKTPNPWCAGFLSWCFQENGYEMPFAYNALARGILRDIRKQNPHFIYKDPIKEKPQAGDLIFWWRVSPKDWRGHCGIVHHYSKGYVFTIEGNKTSKVQGFKYPIVQIQELLGFARIQD